MVERKPSHGEKRKKAFEGNLSTTKPIKIGCWEYGKPDHLKKNYYVIKNKKKKIKGLASSSLVFV